MGTALSVSELTAANRDARFDSIRFFLRSRTVCAYSRQSNGGGAHSLFSRLFAGFAASGFPGPCHGSPGNRSISVPRTAAIAAAGS